MKLRDLLDKRHNLIEQGRAILKKAEDEKRDLTAEERTNYDKAFSDQDALKSDIERLQRQEKLDLELAADPSRRANPNPGNGDRSGAPEVRRIDDPQHRYRLSLHTIDDEAVRSNVERRSTPEYNQAFRQFLFSGDRRSLDAGTPTGGGFVTTPVQFVQDLIRKVDDLLFIRKYSTVRAVPNAQSLGAASLDSDPADPIWTSELDTGDEDGSMAFGQRELKPHPLAKRLKVSNKLMRMSFLDIEGLVRDRLAYKRAVTEEKGFLTGSGAGQPLGVFTASTDGISTGRDVSSGNTSTSIGMDGLKSAKYSLKAPYLKEARWTFHRDGFAQISKLKDTTNNYLWQPSTQLGEPDRILGLPADMSEYVPNTFTTGLYVGILAAWSNYWIADALDMTVQRLAELYAATNQTGFISRSETDGMPVLEEAFARVKLA